MGGAPAIDTEKRGTTSMPKQRLLRPIWTPADAEQAARDAAKHRGRLDEYQAQAALYASEPISDPEFVVTSPAPTPWTHRNEFGTKAHEALIRDVGRSCGGCGAGPLEACDRDCLKQSAGRVGMRPRRAALIGRWLIAIATLVLFLSVAAVWIAAVPR